MKQKISVLVVNRPKVGNYWIEYLSTGIVDERLNGIILLTFNSYLDFCNWLVKHIDNPDSEFDLNYEG